MNHEGDKGAAQAFERLFARYPDLLPIGEAVHQAYVRLRDAYARGGRLLVCGNGGSAADAEHIVGELMKGFTLKRPLPGAEREKLNQAFEGVHAGAGELFQSPLQAIAITGHTALGTAFANDVSAELGFAQQVLGYGRRGDVLLAISTSGSAKNVRGAAVMARHLGMEVIALSGGDGGALRPLSDLAILAPGDTTAQIQERHLPIYHTLCEMLENHFFGRDEVSKGD